MALLLMEVQAVVKLESRDDRGENTRGVSQTVSLVVLSRHH